MASEGVRECRADVQEPRFAAMPTAPRRLTYLAAVFAAAGHDAEAASSLADRAGRWRRFSADLPVARRCADAHAQSCGGARAFSKKPSRKWPSDLRFAKPLAYLYATFGQGREAVRALSALPGGARRRTSKRCISASSGSTSSTSRAHRRRRAPKTSRARAQLRERVREGQGPAGRARQTVDGISREDRAARPLSPLLCRSPRRVRLLRSAGALACALPSWPAPSVELDARARGRLDVALPRSSAVVSTIPADSPSRMSVASASASATEMDSTASASIVSIWSD